MAKHGNIVQCQNCGMVYNNPQFDPNQLLRFYSQVEDPAYIKQRQGRELTFKHSLKQLHEFVKPPGNLLDMGCYTGVFLEAAFANKWNVYGIELSSWAVSHAQKLGIGTVFQCTLDQVPLSQGSMDVITMWDVIEHLPQPAEALKKAAFLLRPGGILALSTHIIDSWAVKLFGRWYPFFMDMHLVHFSKETLKKMLSKQGFEILGIKKHKRIIMLDYLMERIWSLFSPLKPILKSLMKWKRFPKIPININFMGLINVYAKRKDL